ncbi:helix-turn-helix domain-containing protein [Kitasatospora herbaricolor]|uniref:helix-turn-helix domain-containing protein n=1 Tax=Kitasatospora herbaricolor TaxID=68217 RepID=UPI0036DBE12B
MTVVVVPRAPAVYLIVSSWKVYRLVDSGELSARVVGRRDRRIPMNAIVRYLERQDHAARGERVA